jgi:hypothetical protein
MSVVLRMHHRSLKGKRVMMLHRVLGSLGVTVLVAFMGGCGALTAERTVFPDSVVGADGSTITRSEVEAILGDDGLSDDEKADALRDLGIEDEELLAILVDL